MDAERIGSWTVVEEAPRRHRERLFHARCECGTESVRTRAQMRANQRCRACAHKLQRRTPVEQMRAHTRVVESGCHEWTGATVNGYGSLGIAGRTRKAHRVAWEIVNGTVPTGMAVCHRCDNPLCVNVDHLFLGTHAENMADMKSKGRANPVRGERAVKARLTDADVIAIREAYATGEEGPAIAARHGISRHSIQSIVTGRRWAHLPVKPRRISKCRLVHDYTVVSDAPGEECARA